MPGEARKIQNHRYYEIGGITVKVEAELPITERTFAAKFKPFETGKPGDDMISIKHCFSLPAFDNLGEPVYRKDPWLIFKNSDAWTYIAFSRTRFDSIARVWKGICDQIPGLVKISSWFAEDLVDSYPGFSRQRGIYQVAVFDGNYSSGRIYNRSEELFSKGNLDSITMFPTDQVLLARVFADRAGCFVHAAGVALDGKGLLFAGNKDAGKSTVVTMLKKCAHIFCDDRMIVRRWRDGFRIHGTWSHGDVSDVSPDSAPMAGLVFLEKGQENRLTPLDSKQEIIRRLLPCVIKPFATAEWWEKTLLLVEKMLQEVPCYSLSFDRSGQAGDLLKRI